MVLHIYFLLILHYGKNFRHLSEVSEILNQKHSLAEVCSEMSFLKLAQNSQIILLNIVPLKRPLESNV